MAKKTLRKEKTTVRANEEIPYEEARVIYKEHNNADSENDFNKIMKISDAMKFAEDKGLDLIEINPNAKPPIIKVYDYTKYIWELKQIEKKKKKNVVDTKEIQLSVNISKHDMETKAKHAKEFLSKGEKVRVILIMRGRELTRREESSKSFYEFLSLMGDDISYDFPPRNEENKIVTVLRRKK